MIRITRRQFLTGVGASGAVAAMNGLVVEPRRITVTRHRLGLASHGGRALRLVQVTDLHLQHVTAHVRRIASAVNRLEPDVIVLTGDMIDRADRLGQLATFLSLLDRGPARLATLGNWEHWCRVDVDELRDIYRAADCRLLINETSAIAHEGREVLITGLDDWTGGAPDLVSALQGARPASGHIVLAHSPIQRDEFGESLIRTLLPYATTCVLSGHTHGGQIALFGWAPVRPAGSGKYVAGWYRQAWPPLYVSRGLGTSLVPVRFGAPPELSYFEWHVPAA